MNECAKKDVWGLYDWFWIWYAIGVVVPSSLVDVCDWVCFALFGNLLVMQVNGDIEKNE